MPTLPFIKRPLRWLVLVYVICLSACYQHKAPERDKIDTLILLYETAHDRKEFQSWLRSEHIDTRLLSAAGGKAEFVLESPQYLDSEKALRLREFWKDKYQMTFHKNHILLNCCQP